jgi:sugar/nucleoside kinase (ribokinase family)
MIQSLKEHRVDVSHVICDPNVKTGLSVILNRLEDRAILTYLGAMDKLREEDISSALMKDCRHLHVASYFLQHALRPDLPKLFKRAKKHGLTTSLDTNWDPDERWQGLDAIFPLTDIFFPNRNELLSITNQPNVDGALDQISAQVPLVALKLGAEGAIVSDGDFKFRETPPSSSRIADTVGAGDSFNAGFTYGYLNNWPLEESLRLAVACGSLSLRKHGGTAGQATIDEAKRAANL